MIRTFSVSIRCVDEPPDVTQRRIVEALAAGVQHLKYDGVRADFGVSDMVESCDEFKCITTWRLIPDQPKQVQSNAAMPLGDVTYTTDDFGCIVADAKPDAVPRQSDI